MQVHRDIDNLPHFRNAVITIGTFDGVHNGHQKILSAIRERAAAVNGEAVVITFHPHPRKIVTPDTSLQLINTLEEKTELLRQQGIDHLVVVPFTPAFAGQSPEAYISDFLIDRFHPHTIAIGYDHHFGKDRKGNYRLLEQQASRFRYQLIEIPQHVLHEIAVSSTKIREAILKSDVETANELLGYSFFFSGKVVAGDQIGRQLGYPTANLELTNEDKIRLGHGVYAVQVLLGNAVKKGMLSIGNRPTLNQSAEKTEVHIFDFNEEIYGRELVIQVQAFLRPQEKYEGLEALKKQLAEDRKESLKRLSRV